MQVDSTAYREWKTACVRADDAYFSLARKQSCGDASLVTADELEEVAALRAVANELFKRMVTENNGVQGAYQRARSRRASALRQVMQQNVRALAAA
jgi:hypothetical protein